MAILSAVLKIIILYTTVIGLFSLLPRRKIPVRAPGTRFAVLIAARNEEAVISPSVGALLRSNYPKELFDVFVIPNNCTDDTAGAAARAGAKILSCAAPVHNKGDVLHHAFAALSKENYDAYCVFDADNLVDPDFLARMNDAILAGARAAKGKQKSLNPGDSWVSGGYDIYRESLDWMYSRARANIGLSAKLMGTGFAVTRELMAELGGWHTETITEDTEFAAQLSAAGVKIWWVPDAVSYDEEPVCFRQSLVQRLRWCSGVQAVGRKMIPGLWKCFFQTGNFLAADFALFLSLSFAQVFALIPAAWNFAAALSGTGWLAGLVFSLLGYWLGTTALALGLVLAGRRSLKAVWKSVLLYPIFTASWLPLQVISLFRKTIIWKPITHRSLARSPMLPTR